MHVFVVNRTFLVNIVLKIFSLLINVACIFFIGLTISPERHDQIVCHFTNVFLLSPLSMLISTKRTTSVLTLSFLMKFTSVSHQYGLDVHFLTEHHHVIFSNVNHSSCLRNSLLSSSSRIWHSTMPVSILRKHLPSDSVKKKLNILPSWHLDGTLIISCFTECKSLNDRWWMVMFRTHLTQPCISTNYLSTGSVYKCCILSFHY